MFRRYLLKPGERIAVEVLRQFAKERVDYSALNAYYLKEGERSGLYDCPFTLSGLKKKLNT